MGFIQEREGDKVSSLRAAIYKWRHLKMAQPVPKFRRKLGHGAKTGQNRAATKFGTSSLCEPPVCRLCHLKVAPPANPRPHKVSWRSTCTVEFGLFFPLYTKFQRNFACDATCKPAARTKISAVDLYGRVLAYFFRATRNFAEISYGPSTTLSHLSLWQSFLPIL